MKDNIIEIKVNKLQNLSQKIKEFVNQKSNLNYTPFYQKPEDIIMHQHKRKPKRSLTDWRQLFEKKNNKISPNKTYSPSTADGFRIRYAMTGSQKRSNDQFVSNKPYSMACNRFKNVRQSRRSRFNENKRQSIIQFAFAQTHYENTILKGQQQYTLKEKEFIQNKKYSVQRQDYSRIGQLLSDLKPLNTQQSSLQNATDRYLNKMKVLGNVRLLNYNTVKINDTHKINNLRFVQDKELKEKRMLLKGMRYYSRG